MASASSEAYSNLKNLRYHERRSKGSCGSVGGSLLSVTLAGRLGSVSRPSATEQPPPEAFGPLGFQLCPQSASLVTLLLELLT